uniref:Trans-1,2-dihydrobenzene-1,2-diol dehydrogenase n=1 Tax=Lutzomyia longipalpis TaxID=7200 RepID=A0A1B0CN82_LUTLO
MALKWGIVATGSIAQDFVIALSTLPEEDHKVVAVGARDKNRAEEFAKTYDIPKAYKGYDAIAKDPDVEIVYVATLNTSHYDISMQMLEHGKHILCEKPLCMNEKAAKKLIKFAKSKNLFLMESIWSRFFPAYKYLKEKIDAGQLGEIRKVNASIGFPLSNDRMLKKNLGGGTILNFAVYPIQLCQWVFREPPKEIRTSGKLNEDGVDIEIECELIYSNGVSKFEISTTRKLKNEAIIVGTKGQITLNDIFWCPITLTDTDGTLKTWVLPKGKYLCANFPNSSGLSFEAEEVRKCIRAGRIQSNHASHDESLLIANIEDEMRRQVGVKYDADDDGQ